MASLNKHLIFQVVYAFTCKTWPNLITCCIFVWSLLLFYCLPLTDLSLFKECPFKNCHVVQSVCLVSPHRQCHVRTGLLKSLFRDFSVVSVCVISCVRASACCPSSPPPLWRRERINWPSGPYRIPPLLCGLAMFWQRHTHKGGPHTNAGEGTFKSGHLETPAQHYILHKCSWLRKSMRQLPLKPTQSLNSSVSEPWTGYFANVY